MTKEQLINILGNIQHGKIKLLPTWMIEPLADALIENNVVQQFTVAYLCDGKACDKCCNSYEVLCCHTTDIRHAIDFEERAPSKYMQIEVCD